MARGEANLSSIISSNSHLEEALLDEIELLTDIALVHHLLDVGW